MTIFGYVIVSFGLGYVLIIGFLKNGDRLHVLRSRTLWLYEGMFV